MLTKEALQQVLAASLDAANVQQEEHFFSTAADCLRALILDRRFGPRKTREVKHALAQVCGTAVGGLLEEGCKRLGWTVQEVVVLGFDGTTVEGRLDVRAPGLVIDWKLVGENAWKRVQSTPNEKHVVQCNGYAHATKQPRWVIAYLRAVSIFRPGELEWRIYSGSANAELAQLLVRTWAAVNEHVAAGTLPERDPHFSKDHFPCGWCDHAARCWG